MKSVFAFFWRLLFGVFFGQVWENLGKKSFLPAPAPMLEVITILLFDAQPVYDGEQ